MLLFGRRGLTIALAALLAYTSIASASSIDVDLNEDGVVDNLDADEFIELYSFGDLAVDFNNDGNLSDEDLEIFSLAHFEAMGGGE